MAAGQLFAERLYPIMSNTGILIFIITIEAVMVEVDKDIVAIENEASFLVCVALKGDQISVARPSVIKQRNDTVLLQDEETPTILSDQVDTDAVEEVQTVGVVSLNLEESDDQNNATEGGFQDEETPAVKEVESSTPEELPVQNHATDDDDHNSEKVESSTPEQCNVPNDTTDDDHNSEIEVKEATDEPSQLENTPIDKKDR